MPIVPIASLADPRVASFRDVPDAVLLRERGEFVAEGRWVVERLLTAPRCRPRALLTTERLARVLGDQLTTERARDLPIYVTPSHVLRQIGGLSFHRGCLALGERPLPVSVETLLPELPAGQPIIICEQVGNADNIGGIFRNAAAFGAAAVLLDPRCCDPLYRKAIRTSMGATLHLPYATLDAWPRGLDDLRARGYFLVALTPDPNATASDQLTIPVHRPVALLVGAEGAGLSAHVLDTADAKVRIAIQPAVDSLNVATAVAVALYELTRHRRAVASPVT